jgi:hypothetical protein
VLLVTKPDPRLVDAQEMAKKNPDTFQGTPAHRLELIGKVPDALVKVCLEDEEFGERFWVAVDGAAVDGVYPGTIKNHIKPEHWGLMCGDPISFEARHVYDTLFPGETP